MLHHRIQLILAINLALWLLIIMGVRYAASEPVLPPFGHTSFCIHAPAQCVPVAGEIHNLRELNQVNSYVNANIAPDQNTIKLQTVLGRDVDWLVWPRSGVCHDYAVTKQAELLHKGWPSSALQLAEVVTPANEHHLVLLVEGRYVLDSLSNEIGLRSNSSYQFVRVQSQTNPKYWER